jgi:AcrR family transcriptional regulator
VNIVHFVNTVHSEPAPAPNRREKRLDAILAAAARLVAEEGLEALTLHRLAREQGFVTAALYRYFESKDALVAELQRRTLSELHTEFSRVRARARAETAALDPVSAALAEIFAVADFYASLPKHAPEHFGLVSVLLSDPRRLVSDAEAKKTAPLLLAFLGDVRDLLDEAASAGALAKGDAFDRTLVLWSSLQGSAQLGKISRFAPERFDAKRLGRLATLSLLAGWGAPAAALERALAQSELPRAKAKTKTKPRK